MEYKLRLSPPLHQDFLPASIFNRNYKALVKDVNDRKSKKVSTSFYIAIERECGNTFRYELEILPEDHEKFEFSYCYVERTIKFLLWAQGGYKLYLSGHIDLCHHIQKSYSRNGERAFDCRLMERVYDNNFEVIIVNNALDMPKIKSSSKILGGNFKGGRIGFDLGASDYKIAAVNNGEVVFSDELHWDPTVECDPLYHENKIEDGLKIAASHLPRLDAIGGSSAGIIINNQIKIASLFRSVPEKDFKDKVSPLFQNIKQRWKVPQVTINDGDVTALAGALTLKKKGILGIAMGSSEACGFYDKKGMISGQLNELAFAPVDYSDNAFKDEWSGDIGVGALYFSQQAVNALSSEAGIKFPQEMGLPERLKEVQKLVKKRDKRAIKIFETIGIYLGYTLPLYYDFYDFENVMILGRVTSGQGGDIIIDMAKKVLETEFIDIYKNISLYVPSESERRVGQAIAAASLPSL
jgi:predicted NBD/HSP70 family sugar kinase